MPERTNFSVDIAVAGRANPLHTLSTADTHEPRRKAEDKQYDNDSNDNEEQSDSETGSDDGASKLDDKESGHAHPYETNTAITNTTSYAHDITHALDSPKEHTSAPLSYGAYSVPSYRPAQDAVADSFGQDAYYVSGARSSSFYAAGVADGVGGWRANGVDSGIMSRALTSTALSLCQKHAESADAKRLSPQQLLIDAYAAVKDSGAVEAGSTTAVFVTVSSFKPQLHNYDHRDDDDSEHPHHTRHTAVDMTDVPAVAQSVYESKPSLTEQVMAELHKDRHPVNAPIQQLTTAAPNETQPAPSLSVAEPPVPELTAPNVALTTDNQSAIWLTAANVGDCGVFVVRNGECVYHTNFQRTGRVVKQLAVIPERFKGHAYCDDSPYNAALTQLPLQADDVVVVASDGLFDNLTEPPPMLYSLLYGLHGVNAASEASFHQRLTKRIEQCVREGLSSYQHTLKQGKQPSKKSRRPVDYVCDVLYSSAVAFMSTTDGKMDDLSIVVMQVQSQHKQ